MWCNNKGHPIERELEYHTTMAACNTKAGICVQLEITDLDTVRL